MRRNLANTRLGGALLASRWPQFLARAVTLAGFVFTILAGLFGSPVGSHNFAIIFVWIAWWSALKLVFIPFGGRAWCSVCPIPMPGEWLQRGGLLERGRGLGLGRRWPRALRGNWLQAGGFLLIGLFAALTLTTASLTGWVLLGLIGLALALSLVFERRAFCSYLCPIGGFSGLYAQLAPLELRVKDKSLCAAHAEKTCYAACLWGVYAGGLTKNTDCGLCMECLRACPQDNISVSLRPFGADLTAARPALRLDEAFLALVMLGCAAAFAAVFLGPWGALKAAAYSAGTPTWAAYAAGFLGLNLALLPGLFAGAVWAGQKLAGAKEALGKTAARQATSLIPLGLLSWVAFTVAFASAKAGYILPVISDPLGWGWRLLGPVQSAAALDLSRVSPLVVAGLLLVGLAWAAKTALAACATRRQAAPVVAFSLVYTLGMLWLLVR